MRIFAKFGFGLLVFALIFIFIGLYENAPNQHLSEMTITNAPVNPNQLLSGVLPPNQLSTFPQGPVPPLPHQGIQGGVQVIQSLLGLEVKFINRSVNYPGLNIVNDPRYQALTNTERLIDSIKFQPVQGPPFLILIAIAKNTNGAPIIVPGKFDIIRKTPQDGFVLRDSHGRVFFYSGYVMATPAWKNLPSGQVLQDKFCKEPVPIEMCSAKNTVNVLMKKPLDPRKDIPFLTLVQ